MTISILFSSVGRRAQLIDCFRRSLRALDLEGRIVGIDSSRSAPAAYLVDRFIRVPRCDSPDFLETTLEICRKYDVSLLVPTIDTELLFYASHREQFSAIGTTVAVSTPETVEICVDKTQSNRWLLKNGFPTVWQGTPADVLGQPSNWKFPLIAKPYRGSASIGVKTLKSIDSLIEFSKERSDLIVEEIAKGCEYTVNVFVDRSGRCVCAVPHHRMEVRAGEVAKGVTVKDLGVMELASQVSERLPGAYGALNVQGFLSPDNDFRITEINARFGGGYPLAHQAGADFARWLLEELLSLPSSAEFDAWQDGLAMLRYDTAVFLSAKEMASQRP